MLRLFYCRNEEIPNTIVLGIFGGEKGIRTPDTVIAVYTISNRAPSASSDISPLDDLIIITHQLQKIKSFFEKILNDFK